MPIYVPIAACDVEVLVGSKKLKGPLDPFGLLWFFLVFPAFPTMTLNPFAASYFPSTLNPLAEPYVPSTLSADAAPYVPTPAAVNIEALRAMPFFQQRLEKFLFTQYRMMDMRMDRLQILLVSPPLTALKKAAVVFLGAYGTIPLVYEADRWEDPRTGVFVKVGV